MVVLLVVPVLASVVCILRLRHWNKVADKVYAERDKRDKRMHKYFKDVGLSIGLMDGILGDVEARMAVKEAQDIVRD